MNQLKVGFIGLGLIGGSIAKTIKRILPDTFILAYDIDKNSLKQALDENIIDMICEYVDENYSDCDYIYLCTPVSTNTGYLKKIKTLIRKDTILTDVGSVKTDVHEHIREHALEENFIGGHPMAGSEKSGYINSSDHLIENVYYILTPSKKVNEAKVKQYTEFVKKLDAIPVILDYHEHDYITSAISHLPHVIASSLVKFVKDSDNSDEIMRMLAAGGFKDITRIASSSPIMWQQICTTNKDNILKTIDGYTDILMEIREHIRSLDKDFIYNFFDESREYRNSMPKTSGAINRAFEIYCDLIDEAGAIATVATILASNNVSIKNIGIINNREFLDGVLRIEFYSESELSKADAMLRKYNYKIYER